MYVEIAEEKGMLELLPEILEVRSKDGLQR